MEREENIQSIPKFMLNQLDLLAKSKGFVEFIVHLDTVSHHGEGFMANVIRIILKGKRTEDNGQIMNYELPLICKLMPDSATRRETFSSVVLFDREIYFYKIILPIFENFIQEKQIDPQIEFLLYPKCFIAFSEPSLDQYLIVMENLKTLNYDMWNKATPIDFDTAGMVLTELGKFHALSFAIFDQRKDIFDKYFRVQDPFVEMFKGNGLTESMVSGSIEQLIDILDDKLEIEIMENVKCNYEQWIKDFLKEKTSRRFNVLNHGDLWNNNLMFSLEQKPKLRMVDFQLLRLASPAIDIGYYLCTSTDSEIHHRYDELLHIYHDSLTSFLTKLGSDPTKLFTFSDLEDQLRQFAKYGLILSPMLVGVMVSESIDIIDMDSINEDSKTNGLVTFNNKTKLLYKNRMSSVIQLAINSGWI